MFTTVPKVEENITRPVYITVSQVEENIKWSVFIISPGGGG